MSRGQHEVCLVHAIEKHTSDLASQFSLVAEELLDAWEDK
jgi:hypothetical protein